ncbi:MAG: hypothetical protein PHY93_04015 [Bacteriovorax sp.]|nr:hypothetical protein [Bacteriovorax sp.]
MRNIIITALVTLSIQSSSAKDLFLQGRLFLANTNVNKLDNLNNAITNEGLKKIDKTTNFGVEITFPTFRFFEPGMRYTRRTFSADENPSNSLTNYEAQGTQDSIQFLARFPFIRSSFFRFDIFGGVGGNNTTLKISTAASNGELSRSATGDWFATPYYAAGSSIGFGFKSILLYAEGGYEANKVNKLQKTGTISSNISSLDLSGSYFMIGIMFDGIKGFQK